MQEGDIKGGQMKKDKQEFKLRRDKYMSFRGGSSAFYNIYCSHCRHWLLLYQKDGPGLLKRMYLDRIIDSSIDTSNNLVCPACNKLLAIAMIYEKENRPALRLFVGSVIKKIAKSK